MNTTRREFLLAASALVATVLVPQGLSFAAPTAALPNQPSVFDQNRDYENLTKIKVIGIGGAGGNALEHMMLSRVRGVEYICVNADGQALIGSSANVKLQLGLGLGAGGRPDIARELAKKDRARIAELLKGTHMVFILAGMGGGSGTGASPIIAQVARELGILTIAVVTTPFAFEGRRNYVAQVGLRELEKTVDSLIVIQNEKLVYVMGEDVSISDAFRAADDVALHAVRGIAEIINVQGLVGVDLEDIRTVTGGMGRALMGSAVATGNNRAVIATRKATNDSFCGDIDLSTARGLVVSIRANTSLQLSEVKAVMMDIRSSAAAETTIVFGTTYDDSMGDRLRVSILAT